MNFRLAVGFQEIVDLAEGPAAEKAPVGRQGTWMGGLEKQPGIGGVGGGFGLFLCLRTPEDKGDGLGHQIIMRGSYSIVKYSR